MSASEASDGRSKAKGTGWVLKTAAKQWAQDRAPQLAAALAFYTMISLAPMLVVAVFVAGLAFGEGEARQTLIQNVEERTGPEAGQQIDQMMEQTRDNVQAGWAMVLGIAGILLGATAAFGQLQNALNRIWGVRAQGGVVMTILRRLLSFLMVLLIGLLLLALVVLSSILSSAGESIQNLLPGGTWIWLVLQAVVSIIVMTLLFAAVFKVLPDAQIAWKDVWIGAAITAVLFTVGNILIGLYMTRAAPGSAYGSAGALVIILLWVYYSAMIFFYGAEVTQAYVQAQGREIEPSKHAVRLEEFHKQ